MNRIYQGKVTNVTIIGFDGKPQLFDPDRQKAKQKWQGALWCHQLF